MNHVDDKLLSGLRAGEEASFRTLLRRHHMHLVRFAMTVVRSRATAEELVQETWLAVIEGVAALRDPNALTSWIYKILVNKARRRAARDSRIVLFSTFTDEDNDSPAADPGLFTRYGTWASPVVPWEELDPERVVAGRQLWDEVQAAIDRLPPRQRAVILLCDVEGASGSEASDILGISEANQRVLLHRARVTLRQAIDGLLRQA